MKKSMFIMKGNLCSERVRVARAIRNLTQEELARKIQFMGEENMTSLIISRIEKNQRHVCDAELRLLAQKSRVKAEKTKIFFQKASSGFGDVSFKERSGRFKA